MIYLIVNFLSFFMKTNYSIYIFILLLQGFIYSNDSLKAILTPLQYDVTQNCATEPPFRNKYWDNDSLGLYVDIISGIPLFASIHKYNSGTGWPSFYNILDSSKITKHFDYELGYKRIELKSKSSKSHLGHMFFDGPPQTGIRYCINSASLEFVNYKDLDKRGLSQYKQFFLNTKVYEK